MRRTTWFTLFFIPVIPYKTEWLLLCPTCQWGITLDSDQVEKIKLLAEINELLNTGAITAEEYQAKILALNGASASEKVPVTEPLALPEVQTVEEEIKETQAIYCSECGKEALPQAHFCVHCGTKVNQIMV